MFFNQNGDNEKEMSGGAMFGYALVGFIAVVVTVFIVFVAAKTIDKNRNNTNDVQIEQTVETEDNITEAIEDTTEASENISEEESSTSAE